MIVASWIGAGSSPHKMKPFLFSDMIVSPSAAITVTMNESVDFEVIGAVKMLWKVNSVVTMASKSFSSGKRRV